ncbi:flavodoxin family protein [Sphingobacterium faecale]|uniref:Flavodoxin family protein n=1 Tax=Sphingobacterium faecale TaxID=2803775 RepID=A0ABS1R7E3_9SPHI|nr:flavodoxin family protein [Sphingobacterium faecale]MBL1409927.1 flavodoxin family protein [Sphingobacterium faecale]
MGTKNVKIAVIYHSGNGHTKKLALAVAEGVNRVDDASSLLLNVEEAQTKWEELEKVDGIIFGSPTYMGSVSAEFKAFMDATSPNVFRKSAWQDKLAAGFTNAASRSGDKQFTLQYLANFAAQHHMHWINLGIKSGHNGSFTTENSLNRHGFHTGAAAQSDYDVSAEFAPPEADLETGAWLGTRVATAALQFKYGKGE